MVIVMLIVVIDIVILMCNYLQSTVLLISTQIIFNMYLFLGEQQLFVKVLIEIFI